MNRIYIVERKPVTNSVCFDTALVRRQTKNGYFLKEGSIVHILTRPVNIKGNFIPLSDRRVYTDYKTAKDRADEFLSENIARYKRVLKSQSDVLSRLRSSEEPNY